MLYRRSRDGVRVEPSGLRDGMWLLRDRAGRLRPSPVGGRDRRTGRPRATRRARDAGRRVSNVVFMGMGEPFANYDRTWHAVERLHDDLGLSARHLTVSTVGIAPGIRRLAAERLPVNLAVSLHAANDELRNELVPINRRYPLDDVVAACQVWIAARNRRLSFEWALIDGVNDRRSRRERAGGARPSAQGTREPHPAQPDAGMAHAWHPPIRRASRSVTACAISGSTRRCAPTGAPRSTLRAASSRPP